MINTVIVGRHDYTRFIFAVSAINMIVIRSHDTYIINAILFLTTVIYQLIAAATITFSKQNSTAIKQGWQLYMRAAIKSL